MHIANTLLNKVFELHTHKVQASHAVSCSQLQRSDLLSISSQASDVQGAKQFVSSLPDVREDTVSKFRSAIQSGSYQASDKDVAEAILQNAIQTRKGG